MHSVRLALSQVKFLSGCGTGSRIPSISTAYAQARGRCAQVIHMFVHRQQGSSPLAVLAGSSGSARRCLRAWPAGRMRGSGPSLDEIAHLSGPEIAAELSVSTTTVKTHLRNLYAKLGAHTRAEAVESARAAGLLAPRPTSSTPRSTTSPTLTTRRHD